MLNPLEIQHWPVRAHQWHVCVCGGVFTPGSRQLEPTTNTHVCTVRHSFFFFPSLSLSLSVSHCTVHPGNPLSKCLLQCVFPLSPFPFHSSNMCRLLTSLASGYFFFFSPSRLIRALLVLFSAYFVGACCELCDTRPKRRGKSGETETSVLLLVLLVLLLLLVLMLL